MRGPAARPVVIAAGGTGGHVFPAEALAGVLVARGQRVVLMTDARHAAHPSPAFAGREMVVLAGSGLAGRGARALRGAAGIMLGVAQATRALTRLDAAAVVGFGGYPSVAPMLGARLLRRRPALLLHEQNAVLGRANRALARRADALALSFTDTDRVPAGIATLVTGTPVRAAIRPTPPAPQEGTLRLLVLGGSLGARVLSDVVPAAVLRSGRPVRVVQQCRAEDLARVGDAYAQAGIEAELSPFFTNVAEHLAAAHLVIARAGASTVAELAMAGRPAILVPLPHAIDDHQSANARALAAAGGAWVMPQPAFTAEALANRLHELTPDDLFAAAGAAATLARPHAAEALADLVERLVAERVR